ncbi:gephyrin-like molybdotransferase Glp [Aciditerrimonas ferrireducens]|jgi:molybdopterin molybdotransferase|uniref:Molybdopterin molybdenumtransferase n=1 Tax=Aciditerrimonas ferrireducens TaxID=667306 RepID=A0ABV6C507_9ACTN
MLLPLAEARERVLGSLEPLSTERLPLADARGRVLGAEVVAPGDVPSFPNSAMDGYALRAEDTIGAPVVLEVLGTVLAGQAPNVPVTPGGAVRIMTGAPLPAGADAVCMVELTEPAGPDRVRIARAVPPGEHVRWPGDDLRAGQVVLRAGEVLNPASLGVLASIGVREVEVVRRPLVGVWSTGDELSEDPGPLAVGRIRDSNRPALLARLAADDFATLDLGILRDDEAVVARALREAAERCDALVTSGGVSVGDRDVVRLVLDEVSGGEMAWMQVAIKPAKPFGFGRLGSRRIPLFGLPGNPVSSLVSYELFVRPALRRLAGHARVDRPVLAGVTEEPLPRRPDGKVHFLRVTCRIRADGTLGVRSAGGQASHQLHGMAAAQGLAVVPDGTGLPAGAPVSVLLVEADDLPGPGLTESLGVPDLASAGSGGGPRR